MNLKEYSLEDQIALSGAKTFKYGVRIPLSNSTVELITRLKQVASQQGIQQCATVSIQIMDIIKNCKTEQEFLDKLDESGLIKTLPLEDRPEYSKYPALQNLILGIKKRHQSSNDEELEEELKGLGIL